MNSLGKSWRNASFYLCVNEVQPMGNEMRKIIIRGLVTSISDMLYKFVQTLPIGALVGGVTYFLISHSSHKLYCKRKYISILAAYISIIVQATIIFRPMGQISVIDLTPFKLEWGARYTILYASANAIAFIPLGILLPIILEKMKKWNMCVLMGFLLSLFIEISQLVLKCGICQVEDLIMNTVGTFIGYMIYKRINKRNGKQA